MGVRFRLCGFLRLVVDPQPMDPAILCTAPLSDPGLSLDVHRPFGADCGLHPTASQWGLHPDSSRPSVSWGPEGWAVAPVSVSLSLSSLLSALIHLRLDFSIFRSLRRICVFIRESFVEL